CDPRHKDLLIPWSIGLRSNRHFLHGQDEHRRQQTIHPANSSGLRISPNNGQKNSQKERQTHHRPYRSLNPSKNNQTEHSQSYHRRLRAWANQGFGIKPECSVKLKDKTITISLELNFKTP